MLLEGPRTVGKSTLLRILADQLGGRVLDLDDVDTRAAVVRDPVTMIDGPGPVLIDEYQHAPLVLDAIKARLNTSSRPGPCSWDTAASVPSTSCWV
ncbi:MAG: AAA family ATPase [Micrococcales bacterium]|nr:AAA family ATPase [Micrococcales bacterium]MCL2668003.1 AAA family ATPase [Micrococcales bacterium]